MKCIKENKFLKDHIIICKPDISDNELKEADVKFVKNKKIKKKKEGDIN